MSKDKSGMDVITAKRLDGPKKGEVHEFTRLMFNRITSSKQSGVWEVVNDPTSKPRAAKVVKTEESNEG